MNLEVTRPSNSSDSESFSALFEASLKQSEHFKEGEIVKGHIVRIARDHVVVDIGYKSEGVIPLHEFLVVGGVPQVSPGDTVDVYIESREDSYGNLQLSKEKADKLKMWDEISAVAERGELVEGVIVSRVKGGLSVDIGIKAFLPGSQVDLRPVRNLDKLIGQNFKFKVIKFNKKRGNIVLSRRALLEKEREDLKKNTLERLQEGAVLMGTIKNITDYGAFVDLGGIDGLLHVTDISWGRIQHPSEAFKVGDEVQVKVLKYESSAERVSLGMKQLLEDPWSTVPSRYQPTQRVRGKVVSLAEYGAFIEVEPGVEGLVHVSEMSWTKRVKHPSKLVSMGDIVEGVVLDVDAANRRLSVGMKQLETNPWVLLQDRYPVGAVINGKVRNITDFGVFIGVEDGIDGLVHVSDLSWTHRVKHPSELFQKGDELEAVVLNVDIENERFSLGIKQLTDDPWGTLVKRFPRGARVKGKVMKVTDYGAFVEIEPGIDGLVHISEMTDSKSEKPSTLVKVGDTVDVVILDVDSAERRISLSMKASTSDDGSYVQYLGDQAEGQSKFGDVIAQKLKDK